MGSNERTEETMSDEKAIKDLLETALLVAWLERVTADVEFGRVQGERAVRVRLLQYPVDVTAPTFLEAAGSARAIVDTAEETPLLAEDWKRIAP
jgi:hypothetical protein